MIMTTRQFYPCAAVVYAGQTKFKAPTTLQHDIRRYDVSINVTLEARGSSAKLESKESRLQALCLSQKRLQIQAPSLNQKYKRDKKRNMRICPTFVVQKNK